MSGAPITITLYEDGIHITFATPEIITSPALEAEMRRAFDAGEDPMVLADRLLYERGLARLVRFAVDVAYAEDRREEPYPGAPARVPFEPPAS